ncbi:MAG: ATP-binding cassette domain-containing protein [Candidatus Rokuibacteriota bacterium]
MAPVLEVDGLRKSFGGVTAVNDVSLALESGRIYGLIGPNGSGKTTLFNCITGVERRDAGAGVNRTLLNDLLDAVRQLRDRGKTVLLVEHDMKVVMGLCEHVFVLDHGEKIAEGAPGVIQTDEQVIEAYFGR